jgi:DNA-binding NarL/FixJ family response regulator
MSVIASKTIRVAIVEDHDDFREGVYHVLQGTEGFRCVGKYSSLEEAVPRLPEADVILLDVNLPGKSGIDGIALIKQKRPGCQIVMLTVYEDDVTIMSAIRAGADGYLLKKTPPARLLQAVEEAAAGGMPMTPFVARQAITLFKHNLPQVPSSFNLTPREQEVLAFLAQGFSYGKVGENLFISIDTVRNHVRNIYEKLHVNSKAEAVAKAMKQGLV